MSIIFPLFSATVAFSLHYAERGNHAARRKLESHLTLQCAASVTTSRHRGLVDLPSLSRTGGKVDTANKPTDSQLFFYAVAAAMQPNGQLFGSDLPVIETQSTLPL